MRRIRIIGKGEYNRLLTDRFIAVVIAKRTLAITLALMILYYCVITFLSIGTFAWDWLPNKKHESMKIGNHIINCIATFRINNGRLPTSLEELTPDYCDTIPSPVIGEKRWRYWVFEDNQYFHLQFATTDGYPSCNYNSAHPEIGWYEDD